MHVLRKTLGLAMFASLVVGGAGVELAGASPGAAQVASLTRAQKKSIAITIAYGPSGTWTTYHNRYPNTFNWGHDSCSVPAALKKVKGVGWVLDHYSGVFKSPCDYHDFGYRNFGSKRPASGPYLHLEPTRARKNSIDAKFHSRMDAACLKRYDDVWDIPARELCYKASDIFYGAVNKFGDGSFFA